MIRYVSKTVSFLLFLTGLKSVSYSRFIVSSLTRFASLPQLLPSLFPMTVSLRSHPSFICNVTFVDVSTSFFQCHFDPSNSFFFSQLSAWKAKLLSNLSQVSSLLIHISHLGEGFFEHPPSFPLHFASCEANSFHHLKCCLPSVTWKLETLHSREWLSCWLRPLNESCRAIPFLWRLQISSIPRTNYYSDRTWVSCIRFLVLSLPGAEIVVTRALVYLWWVLKVSFLTISPRMMRRNKYSWQ